MKVTQLIPPLIATVIAIVWLGTERRSILQLETEIQLTRESIASRSSTSAENTSKGQTTLTAKSEKTAKPLDWKKIAQSFALRGPGVIPETMDDIDFHQRMDEMTNEQLAAALREINTVEISQRERMMLEMVICFALARRDPALAVAQLTARLGDADMHWALLNRTLADWAKKDPVKAATWFDQQFAAGQLSGKLLDENKEPWMQLQASLFTTLLASDPSAACRRLSTLPEDQRSELLKKSGLSLLAEKDQLAFANAVRAQVPSTDQISTFKMLTSAVVSGGYQKVTDLLDRIQATPAERAACIEEAAKATLDLLYDKKFSRKGFEETLKWVGLQAPEVTNRVIGKILTDVMENPSRVNIAELGNLIQKYHQASGETAPGSAVKQSPTTPANKDLVRLITEKISNAQLRAEMLKSLK